MSWKSGNTGDRAKRGGWSGGGSSRDKPLHRWQDATAADAHRTRRRRQRNRWAVSTVLAVGLLGYLVWLLLAGKPKSQLIVFTATDYATPIPLNAWADEDRAALAQLAPANLFMTDESDQWNKDRGTDIKFDAAAIKRNQSRKGAPLIVYLSMHGVVDDAGKPCLLPPGASLDDDESWIRLADVLDRIDRAVPDTRNVLLVLDSNRIRVNWNLGILYNSFVERVQNLVEQKNLPWLAVITAAAPGQVSWASAELGGSAFGRHLQLGLAGDADERGTGDGDGDVKLQELARYLERQVSAWSQFNRGEPQTPVVIPANADFHVTWAVGRRKLRSLTDDFSKPERSEPPLSPEDIGALWTKLDELRGHDLVRLAPIACREFEHDLLRLEELSQGGEAYREAATQLRDDISEAFEQSQAAASRSRALADHLKADYLKSISDSSWARVPAGTHTLPTIEYFGACDVEQSERIRSLWDKLIDPAGQQDANAILETFSDRELAWKLAETRFLAAVRHQRVRSLWRKLDLKHVVALRNLAEQLAVPRAADGAPGDERAHYYTRAAANGADRARRLAEDALFVGEQNANPYEAYAAAAQELYQSAGKVMNDASLAFRALDQAWAQTPYLAAWLCSPLTADLAKRDELVKNTLTRLIKNTASLSDEINRFPEIGGPDSALPFRRSANAVRDALDELQASLQSTTSGNAQGPAGWRAMEAALRVPLIPADDRVRLLKNRDAVAKTLQKEFRDAGDKVYLAGDEPPRSYLEVMSDWETHPLLEFLQVGDPQVEKAEDRVLAWCETAAADVRGQLKSPFDIQAVRTAASDPVIQERQKLSRAEQALRATAALGDGVPGKTADPIAEQRRFDIQQLLIWHARRVIDDFWGDVAGPDAEKPFFAQAADDYLQAAKIVRNEPGSAVEEQIDREYRLLEARLQAKRRPMQLAADPHLATDPAAPVGVSLTVAANTGTNDYPPGIAALYLRDASRRLTDAQFQPKSPGEGGYLRLPTTDGESQQFELTVQNTAGMSSMLNAVAYFRGREDASPFRLRMLKGVRIDYEPHRYERQSITLRGNQRQRSSYVFVLDCSYSMTAETLVKAGEVGPGKSMERMELAQEALSTMLEEIARRNRHGEGTRVGVRFYGHRAAWSNTTPTQYRLQPGWPNIPKNLAPSQDVEVIHHLGIFDDTAAVQVRDKLNYVRAWGQTPLYLALTQALGDFDADDAETEKGIIAITDGQNMQYEPPTAIGVPPKTNKDDVLAAWKRNPVPIHLLGFDIAADESPESRREFLEIAAKTGGSYEAVATGGDLLTKLKERLDAGRYSVREGPPQPGNASARGVVADARLNESVAIPNVHPRPKEFTVTFRSTAKSVFLEGGEAILLGVSQSGATQDIVAFPFGQAVAAKPLVRGAGGRPDNYLLRVHKPSREKTAVSFPISIQMVPTDRRHFTARPAETWLEVTPLDEDGNTAESYVFYDRNFEPGTPVPVLKWTAIDWPDSADRVRIRFWCKYNATPGRPLALHDLLSSGASFGGVQLSARTANENGQYVAHVTETHGPQSLGIDSVRVQFESDLAVQPVRVSHEFDSQNRIATHSYYFSPEMRERLERAGISRIRVTEAKDVKDGALQLPHDPEIVVSIDGMGEFFSPEAASSGQ